MGIPCHGGAGIGQSVRRRATSWTAEDRVPAGAEYLFFLFQSVQIGTGAHPDPYSSGAGGSSSKGKVTGP
jgi:hypothetical protein